MANKIDPAAFIAVLKKRGQQFQKCIGAIVDDLEEPLRSKWSAAVEEMNQVMAGLPNPEDLSADLSPEIIEAFNASLKVIGQLSAEKNGSKKTGSTKKIGLC